MSRSPGTGPTAYQCPSPSQVPVRKQSDGLTERNSCLRQVGEPSVALSPGQSPAASHGRVSRLPLCSGHLQPHPEAKHFQGGVQSPVSATGSGPSPPASAPAGLPAGGRGQPARGWAAARPPRRCSRPLRRRPGSLSPARPAAPSRRPPRRLALFQPVLNSAAKASPFSPPGPRRRSGRDCWCPPQRTVEARTPPCPAAGAASLGPSAARSPAPQAAWSPGRLPATRPSVCTAPPPLHPCPHGGPRGVGAVPEATAGQRSGCSPPSG